MVAGRQVGGLEVHAGQLASPEVRLISARCGRGRVEQVRARRRALCDSMRTF